MSNLQVLLVDGSPSLFCSLGDVLRTFGLSVLAVRESDQALDALDDGFTPDAIVVHFAAGDAKAAELLRYAKSKRALPVVSISPPEAEGPPRIGPRPDREMGKHTQVAELVSMLDGMCGSPHPAGWSR
jgi:CheY-like chemotaxis protein